IRDRNVTGVQTCALPICVGDVDKRLTLLVGNHKPLVFNVVNKRERLNPVLATLASTDNEVITVGKHRSLGNTRPGFRGTFADMRSEERRVGEERSRRGGQ